VLFRGRALDLHDLGAVLGGRVGGERAGVVVWAGGSRRVLAVDEVVAQVVLEQLPLPAGVRSRYAQAVALHGGEIVPILEPGAVVGAWQLTGDRSLGYDELQRSALAEIANIGSGHAATALSELLGRPVEIGYTETLLATLAEAADRMGAATEQSAVVDTPVAGEGGRVLLLFPEPAAAELCRLLGTSLEDEIGLSALAEVGNILASSYLNAIVEMTGLPLEPTPPEVEVDLLGRVVERRLTAESDAADPAILMRSCLTVEASDASFAFLFVPRLAGVGQLLDALGVGAAA
ncbi:MAG TPA: chemotaxis protein CheC, partial [Gaiellaceae bacterium]|nr:chemotaxis protein CheC [Gaiellaceae bacterium]